MTLIEIMDSITWMEYQMAIRDGFIEDLEEEKHIEYRASILSTYLASRDNQTKQREKYDK